MAKLMKRKTKALIAIFIISVILSLKFPSEIEEEERAKRQKLENEEKTFSVFLQRESATSTRGGVVSLSDELHGLEYDFYRQNCPQAESIVRSTMARIYMQQNDISFGLLRLLFHDCFIKGCDASVFLDDSNGNKNRSIERQAAPNKTLRGSNEIDMIKEELDNACPGVVSCADTLALATRDAVVLAGGPFYPVFTGRRDSTQSYFDEAMDEIPKPNDNITRTLFLFSRRGFDERETVNLLGAHNVGKISCDFIRNRLTNFSGTGQPDASVDHDFLNELRLACQDSNRTNHDGTVASMTSRETRNSSSATIFQGLSASITSGARFDNHYYQNLLGGRGLLFADQQLMADENTARFVAVYASDDGTTFRRDFSRSMVKMSNLGVLTGTLGQVRNKCSFPTSQS
ncbi:Peroxidase 48 [Populus alba x Populus x berolinensis]|uniref:Peroxidase n=1 Tax=Populus alba x Populus x berolinensis TaxID=444605 RepID=A0AAD6VWS5_9ROSI|nr:Peroxidase 48 [Populus alba x Populus x berolinensis]